MPDSTRLTMLLPTPEAQVKGTPPAPRLTTLRGKTIGFIDNKWWSWGVTLEVFETLLHEKHEIKGTMTRTKKASAGVPLTPQDFEDLASSVDAVVCGLGN